MRIVNTIQFSGRYKQIPCSTVMVGSRAVTVDEILAFAHERVAFIMQDGVKRYSVGFQEEGKRIWNIFFVPERSLRTIWEAVLFDAQGYI